MPIGTQVKTGDTVPETGTYEWQRYTDGTYSPSPTADEKREPMIRGNTVPPIRSCNKGAIWKLIRVG